MTHKARLSEAELAEIDGWIASGDHDSMCAAVGRAIGEKAAVYFRGHKNPRRGCTDPEKSERDRDKAEFKGVVDYFVKEEQMGRSDAFHKALEIKPMPDEDVAWDVAIGKRGDITRLSKTIDNHYVTRLRLKNRGGRDRQQDA